MMHHVLEPEDMYEDNDADYDSQQKSERSQKHLHKRKRAVNSKARAAALEKGIVSRLQNLIRIDADPDLAAIAKECLESGYLA
jgi:hypothetical protein